MTDDLTHGAQEGADINGYYQSTCDTPLYIFCGRQLLVARLRPANGFNKAMNLALPQTYPDLDMVKNSYALISGVLTGYLLDRR